MNTGISRTSPILSLNTLIALVVATVAATGQVEANQRDFSNRNFHSEHEGAGVEVAARNGFQVRMEQAHRHFGSRRAPANYTRVVSPWGEELEIFLTKGERRVSIRIVGIADVDYVLGEGVAKSLEFVQVTTASSIKSAVVSNRAERVLYGFSPPDIVDGELYADLAAELRTRFSPEFLAGLEELEGVTSPATCTGDMVSCTAAITSWLVSVGGVALGCSTLTPACIATIIGHELASAGVVISCSQFLICLAREKEEQEHPVNDPHCG